MAPNEDGPKGSEGKTEESCVKELNRMDHDTTKPIRRKARHGVWTVWRLLVACRLVETVAYAHELCKDGEVMIGNDWTIDTLQTAPVGFTPLVLIVLGRKVIIDGVSPDDSKWASLLNVDTSGKSEPPIPGARLIIPMPYDLKKRTMKTKAGRTIVVKKRTISSSSSSSSSISSVSAPLSARDSYPF